MIVLDASVLANLIGDDGDAGRAARAVLLRSGAGSIPDLADVEAAAALRKIWLGGAITTERFEAAIEALIDLPLDRYPSIALMKRAFELRDNVTPYDATYVALAEALDCPVVTLVGRLSRAPGIRCRVVMLDQVA